MKRMIIFVITAALLTTMLSVGVSAALAPIDYGDVNRDHNVDTVDAVLIQRHVTYVAELSYTGGILADYDHDGEISLVDATFIQRKATMISVPDWCGGTADPNITVTSFYADYESSKAAVGVPVTFTAESDCASYEPMTYEFFIDGELMQARSGQNSFVHTFTESGCYNISVTAYNSDGFRMTASLSDYPFRFAESEGYRIAESCSYDEPTIVSAVMVNGMFSYYPEAVVNVVGGAAPYTYSYTIPDVDAKAFSDYLKRYGNEGWQLLYDDSGSPYLYMDFSEANAVHINLSMFEPHSGHDLVIQVKDAECNMAEPRTLYFSDEILIG